MNVVCLLDSVLHGGYGRPSVKTAIVVLIKIEVRAKQTTHDIMNALTCHLSWQPLWH